MHIPVGHKFVHHVGERRIKWMFTTDKARAKMGRAYPVTSKES
jgi:hypothetical protein